MTILTAALIVSTNSVAKQDPVILKYMHTIHPRTSQTIHYILPTAGLYIHEAVVSVNLRHEYVALYRECVYWQGPYSHGKHSAARMLMVVPLGCCCCKVGPLK